MERMGGGILICVLTLSVAAAQDNAGDKSDTPAEQYKVLLGTPMPVSELVALFFFATRFPPFLLAMIVARTVRPRGGESNDCRQA